MHTNARRRFHALALLTVGLGFALPGVGCDDDSGTGGSGGSGGSGPTTTSSMPTKSTTTGPTTVTCMASGTAGSPGTVCIAPIAEGGGGQGGDGQGGDGSGGGIPSFCPSVEDATPLVEQAERHVLVVGGFAYVSDEGECCYNILHDLCY